MLLTAEGQAYYDHSEIFLIAGYGEHTAQGGAQAAAKLANLAVGIVWYSTVIATFVNRISRVR